MATETTPELPPIPSGCKRVHNPASIDRFLNRVLFVVVLLLIGAAIKIAVWG